MGENKIFEYLVCPCCKEQMELSADGRSLYCKGQKKHCYDFSSKGYVNLAMSRTNAGDSKQAVRSRTDFLNKGYYEPISNMLVDVLKGVVPGGIVIDAGCGEGYYAERIARAGFSVIGADLSKPAVSTAASRLRHIDSTDTFACVASIFEMPFADKCADAVVSVFAPCAQNESVRLLKDGGALVIVSAGEDHLLGLKEVIYDNPYKNDARSDAPDKLGLYDVKRLKYSVTIDTNADILNLFSMTPYYWRTSPYDTAKLSNINSLTTPIDIIFSIYKKIT